MKSSVYGHCPHGRSIVTCPECHNLQNDVNSIVSPIIEQVRKDLGDPIWVNHKIGDTYTMDGKPDLWKIAYYPIFECGKTGEEYNEPRALMEKVGVEGFWSKEVPLRYLTKTE